MRPRRLLPFLIVVPVVASVARAQAPDRSRPPQPGPPPAFQMPPVVKRTLGNGVPVWVVERHDVPVVQVNLAIRAGAGADPSGKYGLASLTGAMLDEGAGTRSALELADAVESLGATLQTAVSMDASAVRLHVPVARIRDALSLMADVALRPTFPERDLERVRNERLVGLAQLRDDAEAMAQVAFPRVVFGPAHRYGTPPVGTAETIRAISVADLRDFHRRFYMPGLSLLVAVGDVSPDSVVPMLEEVFGRWTAEVTAAPPGVPEAPQLTRREIVIVNRPAAAQSAIEIGNVGVARATPDFFPLTALNTVLGGSFTSRLNQNLRETHGYSYGAFSSFEMRRSAGPFFAAAAVQTDKTAEAVQEFFKEFEALLQPVPESELRRTLSYVALAFPSAFATTGGIADELEDQFIYGLPDDFFSTFIARIQAVTPREVEAAARRYIRPGAFAVVVVGDRQAIEPKLRALNLGPVRVVTVDDVLGAGSDRDPMMHARPIR